MTGDAERRAGDADGRAGDADGRAGKRDAFFAALAGGPRLMGIVNVTPDSFSDGGRFLRAEAALAEARRHVADGASVVDVGAESTRPGHVAVDAATELARLSDVLASLIVALPVAVSIDTTKAAVAAAAIRAGAVIVNDQRGLQGDPAMADAVAAGDAGLVMMHNPAGLDADAEVVDDLRRFFDRSLAIAERAGIVRGRIVLDPGIGFGKSRNQNLRALGPGVASLRATFGLPVLVGASRKSFIGALAGGAPVEERLAGTLAAHLVAFAHGAELFRVHDCREHRDAFAVAQAIAVHAAADG